MEVLFKMRFIPLVLGLVTSATGLCLKFGFYIYPNFNIIKFGIILTVAGFIFLRLMQDIRKNKKTENSEPVKTSAEIEMEIIEEGIDAQINYNIPAALIRIFFGTMTLGGGICIIIFNKEIIFGSVLSIASIVLLIPSFVWAQQYFKTLKELKEKKKEYKITYIKMDY
jgi:hypothetical protein